MFKDISTYIKNSGILILMFFVILYFNHSLGYVTYITLFLIACFALNTIRKRIKKQEILLILFLISYMLFSNLNGITYNLQTCILYFIAPFFFYQFGEYVAGKYKNEKQMTTFWIITILCYCLDIFIVGINNIYTTGQLIGTIGMRHLEIESAGTTYSMSATGVGLCLDIAMVGFPMFMIAQNNKHKIAFLLLFIFGLLITFNMLSRTAIVIAFACLFILLGFYLRKRIGYVFIFMFILAAVFLVLIKTGVINEELIDIYTERNEDLSTAGNRTGRWADAISNLFTSPLGWSEGTTYYIHNMWLDIARISGILPFAILVYFAIKSLIDTYSLVIKHESTLSYLLLGLNICFFASCFVEPIFGGTHFMLYCMLWGFTTQIKRVNLNNKITAK